MSDHTNAQALDLMDRAADARTNDILAALDGLMTEMQAEAGREYAAADRCQDEAYGLTSTRLRGRGEGINWAFNKVFALRERLAGEVSQ